MYCIAASEVARIYHVSRQTTYTWLSNVEGRGSPKRFHVADVVAVLKSRDEDGPQLLELLGGAPTAPVTADLGENPDERASRLYGLLSRSERLAFCRIREAMREQLAIAIWGQHERSILDRLILHPEILRQCLSGSGALPDLADEVATRQWATAFYADQTKESVVV